MAFWTIVKVNKLQTITADDNSKLSYFYRVVPQVMMYWENNQKLNHHPFFNFVTIFKIVTGCKLSVFSSTIMFIFKNYYLFNNDFFLISQTFFYKFGNK